MLASVTNAFNSLNDLLGSPVVRTLERQIDERCFMLGTLQKPSRKLPNGAVHEMERLLIFCERQIEHKAVGVTGRGPVGKVAVVGVKDRRTNQVSAQVVEDTSGATLQGFVMGKVVPGTTIYTDDATAYTNLPNHEAVKHSVAEYVRGQVHTQGIESFWATLKRAHKGTFHRLSPKHLHRYVDEFVGRHNMRETVRLTFENASAPAPGVLFKDRDVKPVSISRAFSAGRAT